MIISHNILFATININMRKLSQRELLEEGFLDAARATGQLAGAAIKGAAKIISPTGARVIGSAAKAIGSAYSNFKTAEPEKFVLQELKKSYYKTFNPNSIKIIEAKKDTTAQPNQRRRGVRVNLDTNRIIVTFTAERFNNTGGSRRSGTYYAYVFKGEKSTDFSMDVRDAKGNQIHGEKRKKNKRSTTSTTPPLVNTTISSSGGTTPSGGIVP